MSNIHLGPIVSEVKRLLFVCVCVSGKKYTQQEEIKLPYSGLFLDAE